MGSDVLGVHHGNDHHRVADLGGYSRRRVRRRRGWLRRPPWHVAGARDKVRADVLLEVAAADRMLAGTPMICCRAVAADHRARIGRRTAAGPRRWCAVNTDAVVDSNRTRCRRIPRKSISPL